ncbi:TonB-dependent receptor [Jiella sp. MQZ9-1]|uniref:TonB-dependent receptor n=1 Tax=Jiella flava TaxID=2816857 RepID=A0A939FUQ7_9HYPH|nr:TonB-dependent receptor [Jiella flava]MBO0662303.1 TonB-dependent receptor [Jiella flava]MCD2470866.1 TonB-dependent receptor [Jiella flava]
MRVSAFTFRNVLSRSTALFVIASMAAAVSAPARAQQEGQTISLDTVVITGGRSPQRISETAHTIYVVDKKEIQEKARAGLTLKDILAEDIPAFDVSSRGTRTNYGQNLRGRTALILIDGVSLNSARSISRQLDSIDPFNVARVEVLSGATALYGGNATGGIINIITKKGRDAKPGLHGEVTAGAQSGFNSHEDRDINGGAAVTYNDDTWDMRISIAGSSTGAFFDGDGHMVIPDITQTSTQFNRELDLFANAGLQIDANQRLEVTAQYYNSAQKSPYGLYFGTNYSGLRGRPDDIEVRDGYQSDVNPATRRRMLTASYSNENFYGQQLLLQGFWRSEKLDFNPFPDSSGRFFSASSQNTDYYGYQAAIVTNPLDNLKVTFGSDGDVDDFNASQTIFNPALSAATGAMDLETFANIGRYPGVKVSKLAGFVEANYEATNWLTITGGYRHQYVKTDIDDFVATAQQSAIALGLATGADTIPGGSADYAADLFNLGATVNVGTGQQVYANFSQGFELPDPAKYYGQGRYSLIGGRYVLLSSVNVDDSQLGAIKTNSYEVGYRYDNDVVNAQVAGYYSLSDKTIEYNRTSLLISLADLDRRVYGVEGKVDVKLPRGFDTGLTGHYVRTEVKNGGEWQASSVTDASNSTLGGHIGWSNDVFRVALNGQHVFDYTDHNDLKLKGYTLFDLVGSYKYEPADITVNFGVLNLFDKDYTTIWGQRAKIFYGAYAGDKVFDYKGRGRTFTVSMTKTF